MKKIIALLLTVTMMMCLVACGKKNEEDTSGTEVTGSVEDTAEDTVEDAAGDNDDENVSDPAEEAVSTASGHGPDYWCNLFGVNRCPFYISCLGISSSYYFRNGGQLDFWTYTEENTGGWYYYDGYVISADNAFAIKADEADSFSSCCEYEAVPYTGKSLSKDEQKVQEKGAFYVINSYSPISTNWGIQFMTEDEINKIDGDFPELTCYGFTKSLKDQEKFGLYIKYDPSGYDNSEKVNLWALKHQDRSKYSEFLTAEEMGNGICLGEIKFVEDEKSAINTFIPNKAAGGLEAGEVDLVITYGNTENMVVGLVEVDVLGEGGDALPGDDSGAAADEGGDVSTCDDGAAADEGGDVSTGDDGAAAEIPVYNFRGYTETADWLDENSWAGLGLPILTMSDDVNGTVHISGKDWIYPLNGSDGILIECKPGSSQIDAIITDLQNAGINMEEDYSFYKGYVGRYSFAGNDMKITVYESELGRLSISIITNPTD